MSHGIGRQRPARRKRGTRGIAVAVVLLVAAVAFIAWTPWTSHGAKSGTAWRSDSTTPRLHWARLSGLPPLSVASFVSFHGRLFVADRVASRVLELSSGADGTWYVDSIIADRPVLRTPVSIALAPDSDLVVYDASHAVHWIPSRAGPVRTFQTALPCDLTEGQLTVLPRGDLVLAGRCPLGAGDTLAAVLMSSADSGRHFTALSALPLFARDGSWGSVLYAKRFVLPQGDSLSFATGIDGCAAVIRLTGPVSSRRSCDMKLSRYSAREPADFAAVRSVRETMGMTHGNATDWPRTLPAFLDRLDTPDGTAAVRLVTGDSIELQLVGPRGTTALLVAPLNGFRGCTGQECLWFRDLGSQAVIELVHLPDLLASAAHRSRRTP